MNNPIVILGGTGFLGAYTALHLRNVGYNVIAVGHRKSDNDFFSDYNIEYIGCFDISDGRSFDKLPTNVKAVVNMSGRMPARNSFDNKSYVDSIINGTINLCEWLRSQTNANRIVFNTTPSDVWKHFAKGVFVDDDAPRSNPETGGDHDVYAISKIAATDILHYYMQVYGLKPIIFRHLNVYGFHPCADFYVDGERKISPWRTILRKCLVANEISVWGNPDRRSELLSVYDFARAVQRAIESDCCGIFNLASDRPYTLEEQITTMTRVFGNGRIKISHNREKPTKKEMLLNRHKTETILGWKALDSWETTCQKIIHEMKQYRFKKLWGEIEPEDSLS